MAYVFGWQELSARYPEFQKTPPAMAEATIAEARALLGSEERWGDLFPTILAAQTGELLSRSPFAMPTRPAGPGLDGTSQSKYWRTIVDCKKRCPYRGMVTR